MKLQNKTKTKRYSVKRVAVWNVHASPMNGVHKNTALQIQPEIIKLDRNHL